jgi:hypothetical protein
VSRRLAHDALVNAATENDDVPPNDNALGFADVASDVTSFGGVKMPTDNSYEKKEGPSRPPDPARRRQ